MAGKAYCSAANRAYLAAVASRPSSRSRRTRGQPPRPLALRRAAARLRPPHDQERDTVERCFAKLKQFRAVATRYDKRDFMYQATVDVASIRIWLRDPVT